jgi:hypothetical protein
MYCKSGEKTGCIICKGIVTTISSILSGNEGGT